MDSMGLQSQTRLSDFHFTTLEKTEYKVQKWTQIYMNFICNKEGFLIGW